MLLFYVDESGGTALRPDVSRRHYDLFSLAAVGIHDGSRAPLAADLVAFKRSQFGDAAFDGQPWAETEIKARYLWALSEVVGGREMKLPAPYRTLATKQALNQFLYGIERIFAKFRPMVFAAIVDKRSLAARSGAAPLGAAYESLYKTAALTLENVFGGAGGAFVADQQTEHEQFFDAGSMRNVLQERRSTPKYEPNFDLLLDKPLWIDSKLSTWDREILQLADLVAFATRAWAAAGEPPRERHFLWDAISPSLVSDWRKGTGARGAGLSMIPDPGPSFPRLERAG